MWKHIGCVLNHVFMKPYVNEQDKLTCGWVRGRRSGRIPASVRVFWIIKTGSGHRHPFLARLRLSLVYSTEHKQTWAEIHANTNTHRLQPGRPCIRARDWNTWVKWVHGTYQMGLEGILIYVMKKDTLVEWWMFISNLSLILPASSSRTSIDCLWNCSWDSTRAASWLTCSTYKHTDTHIQSMKRCYCFR